MMENLVSELLDHDRKSTSLLKALSKKYRNVPGYAANLVKLSQNENVQVSSGATWLLKAHILENGGLPPKLTTDLIERLDEVTAWESQLHICQSVKALKIPPSHSASLFEWLEQLSSHERPFLRAWSIDAACRVALQIKPLMTQARELLSAAETDPAASVRARAKHLRKLLP